MSAHPYSETNPVPTIQQFEEDKVKQQKELEAEIVQEQQQPTRSSTKDSDAYSGDEEDPEDKKLSEGQKEKKDMMEKMQPDKTKPTDRVKKTKGQRVVDDPVTGEKVIIKDAEFKDFPTQQQLDPKSGVPGPATKSVGQAAAKIFHQSRTAPNPAHPSNISFQPFPPSTPPSLGTIMNYLYYLEYGIMAAGCLLWFFFAFGHGFVRFVFRSIFIGSLSVGGATVASIAQRKLEREVERVRFDMHRQRGEKYAPPTPESVEWLNAFTKVIWGVINPDMFVPIADSIEDVMQQSLPKFVEAVRISDIGQGSNPFRIVSMRALPDQPHEKEYPREEWIDQGTKEILDEGTKAQKGKDLEQAGDYVNYEVSFAYQAMPGQGDQLRAKNIHLLLEFFLGFADWVHIPIPIWVQVDGIAGTVRLRLQFIPEAPYVRNLTFTLMGVPAVEVSVVPLIKRLPNILDLPLISTFVKMAIRAGTASLVAPKSMTLNLQDMMSGASIGDTRALGVFVIRIRYAEDLSAQDRNGKSDPYIVLAYAKFGKPLYSTRIILGDLNPVFEETAFMLVTHDEVKADEQFSAMLWDSDRYTADDLIGRVHIPVKQLMAKPNQMFDRSDKLVGFDDATSMSGTLHWSIGYFDKPPLNKELERPEENPAPPKKSAAAMEMRPGDKAPNPAAKDGPPPQPDVQRTPPDPKYPSGILNIVIHQVNNLERQNLKGASGDREGMAGQDTDEPSEQGNNLPSGYCEIVINDDLVYKTRVKQYTTMPFFEAGTEVFIRDWQRTVVRVVVRDSRLREKDPILGIVNLPLAELLSDASEVTGLYSIQEGVGYGRANISVLFKAVDAKLHSNMLGWDTGTVEIMNPIEVNIDAEQQSSFALSKQTLIVSTTDSTEKIGNAAVDGNNAHISWNVDTVRLPVYSRYSSSLTFEIGTKGSFGPLKGQPTALAILWLQDIPDDEVVDVKLPILVSKDLRQLRQNYINEHTPKGHDYKTIGWLITKVRVDKGLDPDHEKYAKSQARRHAFETYDHIEGQALIAERNAHAYDDGVITKEEKKALDAAHKKQLHNRHRGVAQFRPYRTAVWMKEGIKKRVTFSKSNGKREPTVRSEV